MKRLRNKRGEIGFIIVMGYAVSLVTLAAVRGQLDLPNSKKGLHNPVLEQALMSPLEKRKRGI